MDGKMCITITSVGGMKKRGATNLKVGGSMHWKMGGGVNTVKTLQFEGAGALLPQLLWWLRTWG